MARIDRTAQPTRLTQSDRLRIAPRPSHPPLLMGTLLKLAGVGMLILVVGAQLTVGGAL